MTVSEFRDRLNSLEKIEDLIEFLGQFATIKCGCDKTYSYNVARFGSYIIGWNEQKTQIYLTNNGELIWIEYKSISKEFIDIILDKVLKLNTDDAFYKLYSRIYGYDVPDSVSDNVKEVFEYFKSKNALVDNIHASSSYHSATISGTRFTTHTDIEYCLVNCSKQEILDIVSIAHVQPVVNRINNMDFYDQPYDYRPPVSNKDIMESYNDYKDSLAYE